MLSTGKIIGFHIEKIEMKKMKLLRYHLHYSQWHPWVCLDLLAQFPNSAWGFLIPICPKEHLMYFYHHYQWPEVKNMNIYWFQILFWNHGHKKLWWCSFTSRALRMFKAVSSMNCLYQLCPTCTTNHESTSRYWHCLL